MYETNYPDLDHEFPQIKRYYDWDEEERGADYFLISLCKPCANRRGPTVAHAATPDAGEEMECENCGEVNQAAAIWRVGMFEHNLSRGG